MLLLEPLQLLLLPREPSPLSSHATQVHFLRQVVELTTQLTHIVRTQGVLLGEELLTTLTLGVSVLEKDWVQFRCLEDLWLLLLFVILTLITVLFDFALIFILLFILIFVISLIHLHVLNIGLVQHPVTLDHLLLSTRHPALSECRRPQQLVHLILQLLIQRAQPLQQGLQVEQSLKDGVPREGTTFQLEKDEKG